MSSALSIETLIRKWLGDRIEVTAAAILSSTSCDLYPEERWYLQNAGAKRRNEFATARSLARATLKRLGEGPCALVPFPDRSPYWPGGIVGSISHTRHECVVVAGRSEDLSGVGVDLEEFRPVDSGMMDMILRPEERRELEAFSSEARQRRCIELFCAKEAFYKYQYPLTGEFLDFQDVLVKTGAATPRFELRIDKKRSGAARRAHAQIGEKNFRCWRECGHERVIAIVAQSASSEEIGVSSCPNSKPSLLFT